MSPVPSAEPSRHQVWRMFDRIAHRYDLLNRLLSGGCDVAWRKKLCRNLPESRPLAVLDLATGTADVLLALAKTGRVTQGIGLDMSAQMLHFGQQKVARATTGAALALVRGDATCLGLASEQFDLATIAFGIRNVIDVGAGLREMQRVLRPGGQVRILEFSLPGNALLRTGYLFYFRHILPLIGGLISGDRAAYTYLNETVERFPYGEAFCALMRDAGFEQATATPLTFGIATLYTGVRPAE